MKEFDGDVVRFARQNTGGYGCLGVADTSAHAIDAPSTPGGLAAADLAWTSILFCSATVFTAITAVGQASVSGLTGVTFPAGSTLYGNFTTFTLASGSCVAYRGPRI